MKSFIATCRNTGRSCRQSLRPAVPAFAFATVALLLFLGVNLAFAQTPPVVDGNLDDMITYAQTIDTNGTGLGLYITDKPDASRQPDARDHLQRPQVRPVPAAPTRPGHALGERSRNLPPRLRLCPRIDDALPGPPLRGHDRRLRRQQQPGHLRRRDLQSRRQHQGRERDLGQRALRLELRPELRRRHRRPRSRSRTTPSSAPARSPARPERSRSARTAPPARPGTTSRCRSTSRLRCPARSTSSTSRRTRSTVSPRTAPPARR